MHKTYIIVILAFLLLSESAFARGGVFIGGVIGGPIYYPPQPYYYVPYPPLAPYIPYDPYAPPPTYNYIQPSQAAPLAPFPQANNAMDYCREYTHPALVNGQNQIIYGEACRQLDGTWQIIK